MFINIVRANLFRLRRSPTFWICLACCMLIPLAPHLLDYLARRANGALDGLALAIAPDNRGSYAICALVASVAIADLLSSEHGVTRSFICAGHRRAHTLAALATLAVISLAAVLLVVAEGVAFSAVTGVPAKTASASAWCYGFAGLVLYTTAVASLSLMVASTVPARGIGMCFAVLMGLSIPSGSVVWAMDLLADMLPAAAGLCALIAQIQLASAAAALKDPALLLGDAAHALYPVAVSLGWIGAACLLTQTVRRRVTLG